MNIFSNPSPSEWGKIIERPLFDISELNETVNSILNEIKDKGEQALRELTNKFDKVVIRDFLVADAEIADAELHLEEGLKLAMQVAVNNIKVFHKTQLPEIKKIETTPGVFCWQKPLPIRKVGLYIPGGSAPLFSTVLMLAVPAKLAGCKEIIMCTPPNKEGKVDPAILYAAKLAGVTKIFKLGGVQAIGAMAYGTGPVPKVEKIFGPGNQFVMAAKQLVSQKEVAIDLPAGPSEVAVIADDTSIPGFIAADLLSQAEHGPDSQVILVVKSKEAIEKVQEEVKKQLAQLPRKEIAAKALESSRIIIFDNEEDIILLINEYAPEHLIICTDNYAEMASKITNAGSVFLGNFTPESAGDYASGTNHTLPTNGWSRSYSGVNIDSFIKKITFQEITTSGIKNLGPVIKTMAEAEHLHAHKNAVALRLEYLNQKKI